MRSLSRLLTGLVVAAFLSPGATAAPFAFIASTATDQLAVIDTATNAVVASVHGVAPAYGVAVHPNGLRLYFTDNFIYHYVVKVFDTTTFSVVATIPVGEYPTGIVVNSAGSRVYVANTNSDSISVIDTASNSVVATYAACSHPRGLAVNPAGTRLYVACSDPTVPVSSLGVIDAASGTFITMVPLGASADSALGIAVNPAGTRVYAPVPGSNSLAVIDTSNNTLSATVAVGSGPRAVAVDPTGARLYVTNSSSGNVSIIDTATNGVIDTVADGGQPMGVATDPQGARVYVVNMQADVSVIDATTRAVVARIPLGFSPVSVGQFIGGSSLPPSMPPVEGSALQVSAGWRHTCAVMVDGGVKCWGNNSQGQLGDGTLNDSSRPVDVVGLPFKAVAVAAGVDYTCVLSTGGAVKCWGKNFYGQAGSGDIVILSGASKIAAGWSHTCALTTSGAVLCWGRNNMFQLGDGTALDSSTPRQVTGLASATDIAVGEGVSTATTADGRVQCWGECGTETVCEPAYCVFSPVLNRTPAAVPSLPGGAKAVSLRFYGELGCVSTTQGQAACWGIKPTQGPWSVSGLAPQVSDISARGSMCALASGNAMCWGQSFAATTVPGLPSGLVDISSGAASCVVTASGAVMCWGTNQYGEVGDGTTMERSAPVTVISGMRNYQGLWWASPAGSESGWGINFAHQGDIIFATWFTYDTTGRAWWLSMTAHKTAPGVYAGTLYQTHGPAFSAVPFDPAQVTRTPVGSGTLTFIDATDAQFAYTVNGVSQTKALTQEVFGTPPVCTFGGMADLSQATNYQDLWWATPGGSESGWGINLTEQSNIVFGTWFTYDVDGTPMWLSVAAYATAPGVFSGTMYRTTGPPYNAAPFNPAAVTRTPVGTASFTFSDGSNGRFAYTVNGVSQTKSITREVFVSPGTICQ